jgi:hypothetical protein
MTRAWPREFTATVDGDLVRVHLIAAATPQGTGVPRCAWCGLSITRKPVRVHHLLFKGRGGGGDPRNGMPLHDPVPGCHAAVHAQDGAAGRRGLARSQYPHPDGLDPYDQPVRCAWRGWITLLDEWPWWRASEPAELAAWYTAGELAQAEAELAELTR